MEFISCLILFVDIVERSRIQTASWQKVFVHFIIDAIYDVLFRISVERFTKPKGFTRVIYETMCVYTYTG
jgi:hypothetical protein